MEETYEKNIAEEQLRTLFENISDVVMIFDANSGRFIDCNEAGLQKFKCTKEELVELGPAELSPETIDGQPAKDLATTYIQQALKGKKTVFDWVHKDTEGVEFYCEVCLTRFPPFDQNIVQALIKDRTTFENIRLESARNKDRLELALEAAELGCFEWNLRTDNVIWDERMHSTFGLDPESKIDRNEYFGSLVHPEDSEIVQRGFAEALDPNNSNPYFSNEFRVVVKGEVKVISIHGYRVFDADGEMVRHIGTCRDVTKFRKSQEKLEELSNNLKEAQRIAKMGSFSVNFQESSVWWSDSLFEVFEEDKETYRPATDNPIPIIGKESQEIIDDAIKKCLETGKEQRCKYHVDRKDGTIGHLEGILKCSYDDEGNPYMLSGIVRDITESHLREKELITSAAQLSQVSDSVVITDMNYCITDWNHSAEELYGWKQKEVVGKTIDDILPTDYQESTADQVRKDFERHGRWSGEVTQLTKSGEEVHVESSVTILKDHNDIPTGILAINRDVTALKEARRETEESQAHFLALLNNAQGFVLYRVLTDSESEYGGKVEFVSPSIKDIMGISEPEKFNSWFANIHPDDLPYIMQKNTESVEKLTSFSEHMRIYHPKLKEWRWIHAMSHPVLTSDGEDLYFNGIIIDITEQKRAEASKDRQARIFENLTDAILIRSQEGVIIEWNEAATQTFGYSKEESIGSKIGIFTAEHNKHYKPLIDEAIKKYGRWSGEVEFVRKNGTKGWMDTVIVPIPLEGDQGPGYLGVNRDITDAKLAEDALRASEEQFRNLVESSHDLIWETDMEGTITFVNQQTRQIYGREPEEMIGRSFMEFIVPEHVEETLESFRKTLSSGTAPQSFEAFVRHNDNSIVIMDSHVVIKKDEEGNMIGLIGTSQDVTAKKLAEEELKASERRFQSIVQDQTELIVRWLPDGTRTFVNQAYCESFGITEQQAIGSTFFDLIAKEDLKQVKTRIKSLSDKHPVSRSKHQVIYPNDKTGWQEWTDRAFFDKDGNILEYQSVGRDVTKQMRYERTLKASEEKFSKAFQNTLVAIHLVKFDSGEIVDVNDSFVSLVGSEAKKLRGQTIQDVEFWVDKESFRAAFHELRNKGEFTNYETEVYSSGKGKRSVIASGSLLTLDQEKVAIISAVDITERRQAEAQLEQAINEIRELKDQLHAENVYLREEILQEKNFQNMVFSGNALSKVLSQVEQVAPLSATVLILGETGTGKELIARAVHNLSPRKDRPMIKINCAALPKDLIESELFGYEKGAFTGAMTSKPGRFELAHEGTLLLDEIGELPLDVQVKLLRVIQEREFERLGSTKTQKVDVRIVAATHRDLEEEVKQGNFRQDLFFRLNVFPIEVPALRDRMEDIPILVEHFINKYAVKHDKNVKFISEEAMNHFRNYQWPGNIRELENAIERSVILSQGEHLFVPEVSSGAGDEPQFSHSGPTSLNEVQRNHIIKVLESCDWTIEGEEGAADLLGLKPSTLRDRMKKLGIKR